MRCALVDAHLCDLSQRLAGSTLPPVNLPLQGILQALYIHSRNAINDVKSLSFNFSAHSIPWGPVRKRGGQKLRS